jgi:tetratricopeptide (TPR) repeat protein
MPDVEVQAPEIDDIDERATPFKRMIALLVVAITLFAAIVAYLQTVDSNKEERAAREAQRFAVAGLGSQVDASADFQRAYGVYTQAELLDRQRIIATTRQRQAFGTPRADIYGLDAERAAAVQQALVETSPLLGDSEFSETNDESFPFGFQAEVNVEPDEARLRQAAQAELADGHGGKADTFVAILTVLAVSLFLLGLSLTVEGRSRRLLVVPGIGIALICVGWAVYNSSRDVPRTSERALRAVAEGNKLLDQGDPVAAIDAYTRAIEARSDYAVAFGNRADAEFLAGSGDPTAGFISITDPENLARAIDDGERALELGADDDVSVVASLGFYKFLEQDFGAAARFTNDALDLNDRLPSVWFNAAVIEVARGNDDAAEDLYDVGIDLLRDEPEPFVRTQVFSAGRTDLGLARELSEADDVDDIANEMEAKLAAAELELNLPDARPARDAALEDPLLEQNGIFLQFSGFEEGLEDGDAVAAVWYFRPDADQPFNQLPNMTQLFAYSDPDAEDFFFTSTSNGLCIVPGEYRVEVFTGDQLLGSGSVEVPIGELGEQVDDRSELLSTEVCRPVDWVLEEAADEGTFFMGAEDGSASMSIGVLSVGADSLDEGTDALLRETIIDAAAGFGEVEGEPEPLTIGNLDTQTVFATDAEGARTSVSAAVDETGVLRVLIANGADSATLEAIHRELFPGIFFVDL